MFLLYSLFYQFGVEEDYKLKFLAFLVASVTVIACRSSVMLYLLLWVCLQLCSSSISSLPPVCYEIAGHLPQMGKPFALSYQLICLSFPTIWQNHFQFNFLLLYPHTVHQLYCTLLLEMFLHMPTDEEGKKRLSKSLKIEIISLKPIIVTNTRLLDFQFLFLLHSFGRNNCRLEYMVWSLKL